MMNICGGQAFFSEGFSSGCVTEIKQAVKIPVITVGRYTEPQYAELMVEEGRADLIAFGRQSIADPELPRKAKDGELELLQPCIGCLQGCVPNMVPGRSNYLSGQSSGRKRSRA